MKTELSCTVQWIKYKAWLPTPPSCSMSISVMEAVNLSKLPFTTERIIVFKCRYCFVALFGEMSCLYCHHLSQNSLLSHQILKSRYCTMPGEVWKRATFCDEIWLILFLHANTVHGAVCKKSTVCSGQ